MAQAPERLFIALFLDENVDERLSPTLRHYGYDVLTAKEAGRKGRQDEEQLQYAAAEARALLSHDIADFARLHERWQAQHKDLSTGVGHSLDRRDPLSEAIATCAEGLGSLQRG